jgi:methyl-accepting chemotaxis protein
MNSTIERIDAALVSHELWKARLLSVIETGSSEWSPQTVKLDNQCDFGKWLYGCAPEEKAMPRYNAIKHLHAQFHIEAGRILDIALRGNMDNAIAEMADGRRYAEFSASLMDELLKWKAELRDEQK